MAALKNILEENTKQAIVMGGFATIISEINGNLIVKVKDSRVAISKEMANKIMI